MDESILISRVAQTFSGGALHLTKGWAASMTRCGHYAVRTGDAALNDVMFICERCVPNPVTQLAIMDALRA